jgi:hypothetical protein
MEQSAIPESHEEFEANSYPNLHNHSSTGLQGPNINIVQQSALKLRLMSFFIPVSLLS